MVKNKQLIILLAVLSLQPSMYAKQNKSADVLHESSASKALNILKYSTYTVGSIIFAGSLGLNSELIEENKKLKRVNNKFNGNDEAEAAMKEILSSVDKYKNLSYNERVNGFLEEAKKIINECKPNDKGKETDDERDEVHTADDLWEKTKKEIAHTSFRLIYNKNKMTCGDYTYVFGKMAKKLGIQCYNLTMRTKEKENKDENKESEGHSVLLFAKESSEVNGNIKKDWYVLDGRNYGILRTEGISDNEGLFRPEDIKKLQKRLGIEWEDGQIYITHQMHSGYYYEGLQKFLNDDDWQKMKEGYDLCFNKKTRNWEYKKPEPLKN